MKQIYWRVSAIEMDVLAYFCNEFDYLMTFKALMLGFSGCFAASM
jgi:hypothetical protein